MIKKILLLMLLAFVSQIAHSQEIAISFYQGGVLCEGRTASNKYVLGCQNQVCTFDASYSRAANGTIIMNVYNPNKRGFIPATYHIYPNNTLAVFANGYQIATGRWQAINTRNNSPAFRAKPCNGSVGCDCPGFEPARTVGEGRFMCKHCPHKKSSH